jgi:predicted 3-demethylubiquinone-9 3-methyltransferase (glyoxalase superfamily)
MKKITPFLWFDYLAEEAAKFYISIFPNSKMGNVRHYSAEAPMPEGTVMGADFTLDGRDFKALNAGPVFHFTEAISFYVDCETQEEVDHYWEKLSENGEKSRCGWLKDKYGLSWQIVPTILSKYLQDKNPQKAGNVMQAMLKMDKIVIKDLTEAYEMTV